MTALTRRLRGGVQLLSLLSLLGCCGADPRQCTAASRRHGGAGTLRPCSVLRTQLSTDAQSACVPVSQSARDMHACISRVESAAPAAGSRFKHDPARKSLVSVQDPAGREGPIHR